MGRGLGEGYGWPNKTIKNPARRRQNISMYVRKVATKPKKKTYLDKLL